MFAIFRKRWFLTTLGLVLLAALIWFAGPYFAFADYRPLGTIDARLIAIALLFAIYFGSLALKKFKARQKSSQLARSMVQAPAQREAGESADARGLRERFEEAVATLAQGKEGKSLYELPWYAIIVSNMFLVGTLFGFLPV